MVTIGWIANLMRKEERQMPTSEQAATDSSASTGDALLDAIFAGRKEYITRNMALEIPTVAGCVKFIGDMVAMLPVKLYHEVDGKTEEVTGDPRLCILNDDTGDILNGWQWKNAIAADYLLDGRGYAYRNMIGNRLDSLHYVPCEAVSVTLGSNPIYKSPEFFVNGTRYNEWEFIKLTNGSRDGVTGTGVVQKNQMMLSMAYIALRFERALLKSGGNKRGFLSSENRLEDSAMRQLREGFEKMYSDPEQGIVVLNKGIAFEPASSSAVELQLNETKLTNGVELCKLFGVSHKVIEGDATDDDFLLSIRRGVQPVLTALESSLNRDMLLESEKGSMYFAFDTRELLKGDTEKRYRAYTEAINGGWMSKNEIRYQENMRSVEGLNVVSMSLGDVIFDMDSGKYFVPNTDKTTNTGEGEKQNGN